MSRFWAEIDEDWRRKEERALAQRAANAEAEEEGRPAPFPNPLGSFDPTKIRPEEDSPEAYHKSYLAFCKICPPFQPKRHTI